MSEDTHTHTHQVKRAPLHRDTGVLEPGEPFTPTDSELIAFGDNIEPIESAEAEPAPTTADDPDPTPAEEEAAPGVLPSAEAVTELSVAEFRTFVREFDDVIDRAYLNDMLAAEQQQPEPRSTVVSELTDRIETYGDER